ncbi:hypothetical protein BC941DRAFT_498355 [Chlamydoabsidia padenii]|nr:hypothetical protein BC941DRAFT_498355 [Chlamydoabsidia padenii]
MNKNDLIDTKSAPPKSKSNKNNKNNNKKTADKPESQSSNNNKETVYATTTTSITATTSHLEQHKQPEIINRPNHFIMLVVSSLVGNRVQMTVKKGTWFQGVLDSAPTGPSWKLILKNAQVQNDAHVKNYLTIAGNDVVEVLNLNKVVDQDIDVEYWDQFTKNERLFGIKTDYNEEIYTTPLNRSVPGFAERERQATLIANEIKKSSRERQEKMNHASSSSSAVTPKTTNKKKSPRRKKSFIATIKIQSGPSTDSTTPINSMPSSLTFSPVVDSYSSTPPLISARPTPSDSTSSAPDETFTFNFATKLTLADPTTQTVDSAIQTPSIADFFSPPTTKPHYVKPNATDPKWPYGTKSYRQQCVVTSVYDDRYPCVTMIPAEYYQPYSFMPVLV